MNFGGHLIAGWLISRAGKFELPERCFITVMAIAPDVDGISLLAPSLLGDWHRTFGHNIFFAIFIPFLCFLFFNPSTAKKILPFTYFAIFSHFILDLLVTGWWGFYPLYPIDKEFMILTSLYIPENVMKYYIQIGLLIVLAAIMIRIFQKTKTSPLEIISSNFDRFITTFMITPFRHSCSICKARAFYICVICNKPFCGHHIIYGKHFIMRCPNCQSEKNIH